MSAKLMTDLQFHSSMSIYGCFNRSSKFWVLLVVLVFAGCEGSSMPMHSPLDTEDVKIANDPEIPLRTMAEGGTWATMDDDELWSHLVLSEHLAHLGIKKPGTVRGFYRGRALLSGHEQEAIRRSVASLEGVTLIKIDSILPVLQVRITGTAALKQIRNMPYVDYLEPAYLLPDGQGPSLASAPGCSYPNWTGQASVITPGDLFPLTYSRLQIDNAWRRSRGAGVVIGVTDTGISDSQLDLTINFATSSHSVGRWNHHISVEDGRSYNDVCGHGTRVAGSATAPRNGNSTLGVAYQANLVGIHMADGIVDVNGWRAKDAIREAVTFRSDREARRRIVLMAWRSTDSGIISDEISRLFFRPEGPPLFIAAAGTSDCNNPYRGVAFPARHELVMAVTAVNLDGSLDCKSHRGPEIEVVSYTQNPTLGRLTGDNVRQIEHSSSATAIIGGIAALVWSYYPHWDGEQVRQRLRASGSAGFRDTHTGWGLVNAHRAVGGFWHLQLHGSHLVEPGTTHEYSATPSGGDGPFSYQWSTGETSPSIMWRAPLEEGYYTVSVTATDHSDGTIHGNSIRIRVTQNTSCPTCITVD
jgi:hypothetical protein